ncbi:hypothetical protein DPMN_156449 [Dreissena polymorpha]|uniref:B box-type domain-containing protein n=1 Tax=Dreissena polymorpha TaxID=45954 RepID=A0A9D4FTL6_DREPO|nr:hypothetical protein DPMN_156449 [Dreissena polymorpha]
MYVKRYVCSLCLEEKREIESVVYCRECEEVLCDQCTQDHQRITALKRHKLCNFADVPFPEIHKLLQSLMACPKHDKEEVVYWCNVL